MSMIHIMSPDELESLPDGIVVWQEANLKLITRKNYPRLMPMVMYRGMLGNFEDYLYPDELSAMDDIQLKFRYWSHKPTIETMDKEPWIIREEWRK